MQCLSGRPAKDEIRAAHIGQRLSKMASLNGRFDGFVELLKANLASPTDIEPSQISPRLIPVVAGTQQSDLFSAATLNWSVPVSRGFGRRLRYLVTDRQNGKLIGIFGLCDPVFNLRARDNWIGWSAAERCDRLVHAMDIFVLGAVPPYCSLLGGKLIALLAASKEVVEAFRKKYGSTPGTISGTNKNARLALLTTTSALGRSSIYNRLALPNSISYLSGHSKSHESLWYTQGYGHFHIDSRLFCLLQKHLQDVGHPYANGNRFGNGPNWKIRVIRQAARELGLSEKTLYHGIRRQVFLVPLASNTREFLKGDARHPKYITSTISDTTGYWKERWGLPRAGRNTEWTQWEVDSFICDLTTLHARASENGSDT